VLLAVIAIVFLVIRLSERQTSLSSQEPYVLKMGQRFEDIIVV
jgi:hypothetical protein